MAIFLVIGLLSLNLPISKSSTGEEGVLGGPASTEGDLDPFSGYEVALLESESKIDPILSPVPDFSAAGEEGNTIIISSLEASNNPFPSPAGSETRVITYKIKKGDTLTGIAAQYNISLAALTSMNPETKKNQLAIGEEIVVAVIEKSSSGTLLAGNLGVAISEETSLPKETLPVLKGYFAIPAKGINWGKIHNYNAVDIANACGTPITASQEGLVLEAASDSWNLGYGNYVFLEHPNGTKTKYAHMEQVSVSVGTYVKPGDSLGTIGKTGEATGCHLHFEVYGAANPFGK